MDSTDKTCLEDNEEKHFNALMSKWWDHNSPFRTLRTMNKLRVPLVTEGLEESGVISKEKSESSKPLQNVTILDVGCGGGFLTEALSELGGIVHGIDANKNFINIAESHAQLNPSLKNLMYFTTTIEDHAKSYFEKYDAVILSEVLEHVTEKEAFLEESLKCLKPGGSVFITTFNKTLISWFVSIVLVQEILDIVPRGTHTYDKFVSPEDVQEMLKKLNCKTMKVKGMFRNIFTKEWSWWSTISINYAMYAVKENCTVL